VANTNSSSVSVLLNTGNGVFAPAVDHAVPSSPYSLAVGDLNGDGHLDLAVASFQLNRSNVRVLLNTGNAFFSAVDHPVPSTPYRASVAVATVGDMNGDGRLDLAVATENGTSMNVFLNNGCLPWSTEQVGPAS
jgi:hypothetical protein